MDTTRIARRTNGGESPTDDVSERRHERYPERMPKSRMARRSAWIGIALVVAGAVVMALPPARALARAGAGRVQSMVFLHQWARDYDRLVADSLTRGATFDHHADSVGNAIAPSPPRLALALSAERWAAEPIRYDPAYIPLSYPGGDVPLDTGVCTDLVIRAYRDVDVDLQALVHRDMLVDFGEYPQLWGLDRPDASIDQRRVPNLMVYFARHGRVLPISALADDYRPGDVVAWNLGLGMTHIGIVSTRRDPSSGRPLVAHHVGGHPAVDDVLFRWPIIGRFALGEGVPDA